MTCTACGDKPKNTAKDFTKAVIEINNPEQLVLLRKVVIPASMGTEEDVPAAIGKYFNVLLQYEANGHIYLYSSDGIPTPIEANVPQEVLDRIADLESEDIVLHGEIDSVASDLAGESQAREAADTALGARIDSEITARTNADNNLQSQIDQETQARTAADTAINEAISAETTARQTADAGLQGQIDAITASSDVTDIVGTYAQLQAYDTSALGNNDIIKVLQDESQNGETTYYRWSTATQSFTLIGEEGPYYTKSQTDVLLNAKQNTLTAGANIQIVNNTISATDTTYSDFTGTDGTAAGTSGLVPAPTTSDTDKYLKSDGSWATVSGGGSAIRELTTADYNANSSNWNDTDPANFNCIALWKLDAGFYGRVSNSVNVYIGTNYSSVNSPESNYTTYLVSHRFTNGYLPIFAFSPSGIANNIYYRIGYYKVDPDNGNASERRAFLSDDVIKNTTGTSTTSVMSQNATMSMVFADPATRNKLQLGKDAINMASSSGAAIGTNAFVASGTNDALAIGYNAAARATNSVALGSQSNATAQGEMSIGNPTRTDLYNNTGYRLLTNVYDPQSDHDAATKGYVDTAIAGATGAEEINSTDWSNLWQ